MNLWQWITNNRLIVLFLFAWIAVLVTPVTFWLFFVLAKDVTGPVATAYVALMGLPPAVFGVIRWWMGK